jgi:oligopeptide/dipeptide ABC transporter ATP-binding protein
MRLIPKTGKIVGGKIMLNGIDILALKEDEMRKLRGKTISMIFQDATTYLNPSMRVGDQIVEAIRCHTNEDKRTSKNLALRSLRQVGMPSAEEIFSYYPHQLSGGMRQRILISLAFCFNPEMIIADEPTSELDVTIQAQILKLLVESVRRTKTALLLITHDLGIVANLCDRVYVLYAGKVVEEATVHGLFEHPIHPYTVGLLDSLLSVDKAVKEFRSIPGSVADMANPPTGCRFHPRCSLAVSMCKTREPSLSGLERGRRVACWLKT